MKPGWHDAEPLTDCDRAASAHWKRPAKARIISNQSALQITSHTAPPRKPRTEPVGGRRTCLIATDRGGSGRLIRDNGATFFGPGDVLALSVSSLVAIHREELITFPASVKEDAVLRMLLVQFVFPDSSAQHAGKPDHTREAETAAVDWPFEDSSQLGLGEGPSPGNQTVIVVPSNLVNVRPLKRSLKR